MSKQSGQPPPDRTSFLGWSVGPGSSLGQMTSFWSHDSVGSQGRPRGACQRSQWKMKRCGDLCLIKSQMNKAVRERELSILLGNKEVVVPGVRTGGLCQHANDGMQGVGFSWASNMGNTIWEGTRKMEWQGLILFDCSAGLKWAVSQFPSSETVLAIWGSQGQRQGPEVRKRSASPSFFW